MTHADGKAVRRLSRYMALLVAAFIIYGCLYPFHFSSIPGEIWTTTFPHTLAGMRDVLLNIALYVPLGFFLVLAIDREYSVLITIAAGAGLSLLVELAQAYDPSRNSSLIDTATNTAGTALGCVLARTLGQKVVFHFRGINDMPPVLLLGMWMAAQLYPAFPKVHRAALVQSFQQFRHSFYWNDAVFACLDWLTIVFLLARLINRGSTVLAVAAVLEISIPLKVVLVDRTTSVSELAGGLTALAAAFFILGPRRFVLRKVIAPLVILNLLIAEMWPFRFTSKPQEFSWVPFAALLATPTQSIAVVLLQKTFLYGAAIWGCDPLLEHVEFFASTIAVAIFILEWLQRYIPGRTPDITDSLLALVAGLVLWLTRQAGLARGHKRSSAFRRV